MPTLDCCPKPFLVEEMELGHCIPGHGQGLERCTSCGTFWVHHWTEIWMGGLDDEEIDFDTYAQVSEDEAAKLRKHPKEPDFTFLESRESIEIAGAQVRRRAGWPKT